MKRISKVILFASIFTLFATSCSQNNAGQDQRLQKGDIFNGKKATSFNPQAPRNKGVSPEMVVGLSFQGKLFCSGVVVSPEFILTAAHCFDDGEKAPFEEKVQVYQGEGVEGGIVGERLPIKKVSINPLYGKIPLYDGRADIAIVHLEEPLGNVKSKVEILSDHLEIRENLKKDNSVLLMGFGRRGKEKEDGFGVKHFTQFPIVSFTQNEVTTFGGDTDACPGDSGGPLFLKGDLGNWKLLGIVSRGSGGHCNGKAVSTTNGEYTGEKASTQFGLVFDSLCWIGKTIGGDFEKLGQGFCHEKPILSLEKNFLEMCQSYKNLSSSQQNLFEILKVKSQNENVKFSCKSLLTQLEQVTELELSHKFLSDLSPLVGVKNLEKVNLLGNRLRNIKALLELENLKELKIDHIDLVWKDLVALKKLRPSIKITFPSSLRDLYLIKSYQIVTEENIELLEDYLLMGLSPNVLIGPTIDWDKPELFYFLLKKIKSIDDEYEATQALDYTIIKNDRKTFSLLVEKYGVRPDLGMDMALMENSLWAFRLMIKYGVSPNNILKNALENKNFEVVTWVLNKGGDREMALKFAQDKNWEELVSYLES